MSDRDEFLLHHSCEFYEMVYRRCLNPLERFVRFCTHRKDGTKR